MPEPKPDNIEPESLELRILQLIGQNEPQVFWQGLAEIAQQVFSARGCHLLTRADLGLPWQQLAQTGQSSNNHETSILALAERAVQTRGLEKTAADTLHIALAINQASDVRQLVVILVQPVDNLENAGEYATNNNHNSDNLGECPTQSAHASLIRGIVLQHLQPQARLAAARENQTQDQINQLRALLLDSPNIKHSYLLIANQFAQFFDASQASIGQVKNNSIKLQAVSGKHHYNAQSEWADMIETLMEECLDQVSPLLANNNSGETLEPTETNELILAQNRAYQRRYDNPNLLTLAFTHADQSIAFICLERKTAYWSANDIACAKELAHGISSSLYTNTQKYAPILLRLGRQIEAKVNQFVRIEKLWTKLFGLTLLLMFILCCVVKVPYRITGTFVIEAENQTQVSALRDGILQRVFVRGGDQVEAGQLLAELDNIDLRLRQAELQADHAKAKAQMEGAMSIGEYAKARIAEAEVASIEAQLEWTDITIQAGQIYASSPGVLMAEEELSRRVGSPLRKGEVLLVLAQPQSWQAVIEIDEAEINYLPKNSHGEITFVSRPSQSLNVGVTRTETMARSRPSGSIFRVFSEIEQQQDIWWRPGMTGVAKINAGKRTLTWIWTHRLFDWLRLKLWF